MWCGEQGDIHSCVDASLNSLDFFRPIGAALFHSARKAARLQEPVVGLFTKRLASRYPSGSWAQLHAGFGDVFANDTVGRFRMNGAGQQDPDTAYLKLSFRF